MKEDEYNNIRTSLCAIGFSHISKRFYNVITNHPDYWTSIAWEDPLEMVKLCLNRSKNMSLSVDIGTFYGENVAKSFFDVIGPSLERWGSLVIHNHWAFYQHFHNITLKNLKHITFSMYTPPLPTHWDTPVLNSIKVHNLSLIPIRPTVTTLEVDDYWGISWDMEEMDISSFFVHASSFPGLQNIKMEVNGSVDPDMPIIPPPSQPILFNNLKIFSFTIDSDEFLWASCLALMQFPTLEILQLKVTHYIPQDDIRTLQAVTKTFTDSNLHFPKLQV